MSECVGMWLWVYANIWVREGMNVLCVWGVCVHVSVCTCALQVST